MTPQEPIERQHGWLTPINRHTPAAASYASGRGDVPGIERKATVIAGRRIHLSLSELSELGQLSNALTIRARRDVIDATVVRWLRGRRTAVDDWV
jgi:hypothetical protein